jgi:cyanophycin synthetase
MTKKSASKDQVVSLLSKTLEFRVGLTVPATVSAERIKSWLLAMEMDCAWLEEIEANGLTSKKQNSRLFIAFYLEVIRLLYELSRVPTFEVPKVISLQPDPRNKNRLGLHVSVFLVDRLPKSLHDGIITQGLKLSQWMAETAPTQQNIYSVHDRIDKNLIPAFINMSRTGASTIPVLKHAFQQAIPFEHLGLAVYRLGWGSKARILDRSSCELDSAIGAKLAQNKIVASNIIRSAGLPAPIHHVVGTKSEALTAAKAIRFPLVIKPVDLDRGEGVTVGITNETELNTAFEKAQSRSESKGVVVERQVTGVCHRFFVINQQVIYVIKRNPISVVGDGKSSVSDLVTNEILKQSKVPPWNRSKIAPIDELTIKTLQKNGLSEASVPDTGTLVALRPMQSSEWGGSPEDVTPKVHNENLKIAVQAANLFNLNIAGVDIISPDISAPWYDTDAIINEVNFAPFLGGNDIARSYIPNFVSELIEGDGKIPIKSFENEELAKAAHQDYVGAGVRCYLTTATLTVDAENNSLSMPFDSLQERLRALVARSDVDAIVYCEH